MTRSKSAGKQDVWFPGTRPRPSRKVTTYKKKQTNKQTNNVITYWFCWALRLVKNLQNVSWCSKQSNDVFRFGLSRIKRKTPHSSFSAFFSQVTEFCLDFWLVPNIKCRLWDHFSENIHHAPFLQVFQLLIQSFSVAAIHRVGDFRGLFH